MRKNISAGVVVQRINKQGIPEILLVHSRGSNSQEEDENSWGVPQVLVEKDELTHIAAIREFEKTTNLILPKEKELELLMLLKTTHKNIFLYLLNYDFDFKSNKYENIKDSDKIGWFSLEEAERLLVPTQKPIISQLKKKNLCKLSLIVAFDNNYVIGKGLDLPFRQREDLKRVKALTTNQTIIMGMNTFISLKEKPLPNRTNYVISNGDYYKKGIQHFKWDEVERMINTGPTEKMFVFGGAYTYEKLLPYVKEMYITKVFTENTGEDCVYFPKIDWEEWEQTECSIVFPADEFNEHPYQFIKYIRKQ